jgi:hypothetical protein
MCELGSSSLLGGRDRIRRCSELREHRTAEDQERQSAEASSVRVDLLLVSVWLAIRWFSDLWREQPR